MKVVVSCTNRSQAKTFVVAQKIFQIITKKEPTVFIDLKSIPFSQIEKPYESFSKIQKEIDILNKSTGTILVFPEYNGSYPGIFKYFLDHWHETKTFVNKFFCLVVIGSGIGTGTQALRHIQNILLHRRSYIFPQFTQIHSTLIENKKIKDKKIINRLEDQMKNFLFYSNKHSTLKIK